jgi:pimeloyl-ACP methyl ester carboxylesterase
VDKINVNGVVLAFVRRGSGPPLVLMHGNEADHSMFDALVDRLSHDFTVYAYDQRDCGLTENPAAPYRLADLGDDAAALIDGLGLGRAHVYGSSLGGLVAQSLAARHPDRIERLVLGSTWPAGLQPIDFNPQTLRRLSALSADPAVNASQIAQLFFPASFVRERPAIVSLFRPNGRSQEMRSRRGAVLREPEMVDLSRFPRPVLVLSGKNDEIIPSSVTIAIADRVSQAEIVELEGIGHIPAIQDPDRVARILAGFLLH